MFDDICSKTAFVLDWILNKAILIICILLFLMCLYAGYDSYMVYYHADDSSVEKYKPTEDITTTQDVLGEDCVAWLTIDNTNIDYPIMQGSDDEEYLNKDPYGDYSLSGSIFLDADNSRDFSDNYNIIYGHHMDHGVMFGSLDSYLDEDYFISHRTGVLYTESGTYNVALFAAADTDASVTEVFTPHNTEIYDWLAENADIYYEPGNDHLIALSTCADSSTRRTVVFGYLTEAGDAANDLQNIQDTKKQEAAEQAAAEASE